MSDEKWLRDGLADAVPTPPTAPDRASSARARGRRARRRTTILGAAAVAATVAVVATLATTLADPSDEPSPAQRGTDQGRPSSPYDVAACPAGPRPGEEDPLDVPADDGPDAVPEEAVSVRLCQGVGTPIDVPNDALVSGVDAMVALVNGLEETGEPEVCTMDLGPGYRLVFGYGDGSTFVVSGRLYGCRELVVGSGYRADSQAPWDRFIELLGEQRGDLDPPAPPDASAVTCAGAPGTSPLARLQDLRVAALCLDSGDGDPARVEIPRDDLALLLADMTRNTRKNAGYVDCDVRPPLPAIMGRTTWGDLVAIRSECSGYRFPVDEATNSVWEPGAEAVAVLDRLVAEAR